MVRSKDTTKAKRRMRKVGAAVTAVASAGGMVFAAPPATATTYPTSTFAIVVGASYYKGTVTWYNRSVGVDGAFKASGCRRIYAEARAGTRWLGWQSSSTWCDESGPAHLTVSADIDGGATKVYVWMTTEDPKKGLEYFTCFRALSACAGPSVGTPPEN